MNKFTDFVNRISIKHEKDDGSGGSGAGGEGSGGSGSGKGKEGQGKGKEGDGGSDDDDADDEDEDGDDEGDGKLDVSKLPAAAQKLIKDLRKESADNRKKAKAAIEGNAKLKKSLVEAGFIEDDSEEPAEKVKKLSSQVGESQFNSAILESAIEHGVAKEDLKFFRFLVNEAVGELDEGSELGEEKIAELAKAAKRSDKKPNKTSVDGKGGGKPGASDELTLDQFVSMNMGEKAALYTKSPDLYNAFMKQAKEKNLLVQRR